MDMNVAASFILSAFGANEFENTDDYYHALVGALIVADGIFEIAKIKRILLEALKK